MTFSASWAPVVMKGGLLCGHDWDYFPDVNMAVEDFCRQHPGCEHQFIARSPDGLLCYGIRVGDL